MVVAEHTLSFVSNLEWDSLRDHISFLVVFAMWKNLAFTLFMHLSGSRLQYIEEAPS